MVGRVLVVFLAICLAVIYGINAYIATSNLDYANVVTLKITAPETKDISLESTDPGDAQNLISLVSWYNSADLQSIALNQSFHGLTELNWSLKDGRHLIMYAPKQYAGYIFVKDYKLPVVYKFKAPSPQALQAYQVFVQ